MFKLELEKLLEIGFTMSGVSLTDRLYAEDILRLAAIDDLVFKDGTLDIDIYEKLVGNYCLTEFQLERDFGCIPFFRREIKDFNGYDFSYEVYISGDCGSCVSGTVDSLKIDCFGITISPSSNFGFIYIGDSYIRGRNGAGYIGVELTEDLFKYVDSVVSSDSGIIARLGTIKALEGKKFNSFEVVRVVMDFLNV